MSLRIGSKIVRKNAEEKSLQLTEEEALGLLDIVLLSPGDLTPEQRAATVKLSEFCRQFLRVPEDPVHLPARPDADLVPASCAI